MANDVYNYQIYMQNLQNILIQKQTFEIQLEEIKQTIETLSNYEKDVVYKSVGSVLIEEKREKIIKELKEKQEELEIKLKSISRQEIVLKNKVEELAKKINSQNLTPEDKK